MRGLLVLTVAGGSVAHATLTPLISIAGVTPDLPLIMVVLLALRRGPEFGCLSGFVTGLLQDAAGGGLIGVQALTKAVIGFGIASPAGGSGESAAGPGPGVVMLTIAEGLARFALLQIFRFPAPFGDLMMYVVLPQALCNGFVGAAVRPGLAWAQALRGRFEGGQREHLSPVVAGRRDAGQKRVMVIATAVTIAFLVLVGQLWYLQVFGGRPLPRRVGQEPDPRSFPSPRHAASYSTATARRWSTTARRSRSR